MRWICTICGIAAVATFALVVWTAMRGDNSRQAKVVTVIEGPPPGFEQARYVGWVFGKIVGINSSECAWPAPRPSGQPISAAP